MRSYPTRLAPCITYICDCLLLHVPNYMNSAVQENNKEEQELVKRKI